METIQLYTDPSAEGNHGVRGPRELQQLAKQYQRVEVNLVSCESALGLANGHPPGETHDLMRLRHARFVVRAQGVATRVGSSMSEDAAIIAKRASTRLRVVAALGTLVLAAEQEERGKLL